MGISCSTSGIFGRLLLSERIKKALLVDVLLG